VARTGSCHDFGRIIMSVFRFQPAIFTGGL
jgi:hypothetical protein